MKKHVLISRYLSMKIGRSKLFQLVDVFPRPTRWSLGVSSPVVQMFTEKLDFGLGNSWDNNETKRGDNWVNSWWWYMMMFIFTLINEQIHPIWIENVPIVNMRSEDVLPCEYDHSHQERKEESSFLLGRVVPWADMIFTLTSLCSDFMWPPSNRSRYKGAHPINQILVQNSLRRTYS